MRVWLVTVGEPLPEVSAGTRQLRTGLLAQELVGRGHDVTWWTSAFDHDRKRFFPVSANSRSLDRGPTIRFLAGREYRRNISLSRLLNHWQIGEDFRRRSRDDWVPDVILCSCPTIELSWQSVVFGRERHVPVILDVRDLWPDVFVGAMPSALRVVCRGLLWPYVDITRRAFEGAAAITAVSGGYLDWALNYARRERRASDRVFPLGYTSPESGPKQTEVAEVFRSIGAREDAVTCVYSGTFGRSYDLSPVLDVAERIAGNTNLNFQFIICGDGEQGGEWRARGRSIPNVVFTGWLDERRLRAVLLGSQIGLAAYVAGATQSIPNKIIEYLAAGLPIVSSLSGECAALLSEHRCGMTYEAGNRESLMDALLSLHDSATRAHLASNARVVFSERFRAEKVYGAFADYLERAPEDLRDFY